MFLLMALHMAWAAGGWFRLMRFWNARRSVSWVTAISICTGGFVTVFASMWIFIYLVMAWIPWVTYGIFKIWNEEAFSKENLWFPVGLVAIGFIGYPQLMVYVLAYSLLLIILLGIFYGVTGKKIITISLLLFFAFLWMAPFLLPVLEVVRETIRSGRIIMDSFVERSVHPFSLISLFLPSFYFPNGYSREKAVLDFFQGGWMGPVLIWIILWTAAKRKLSLLKSESGKLILIFLILGIIFSNFAMGGNSWIYRLTYAIPLWSSFRWPFKFLTMGVPLLGISAGLALDLLIKRPNFLRPRLLLISIFSVVTIGLLVYLRTHFAFNFFTPAGILAFTSALGTMWMIPFLEKKVIQGIFLFLVFSGSIGTVALAHNAGAKTYEEAYGQYGPLEMGMDVQYRLMPITSSPRHTKNNPVMQPLGLFQSATANGYFSLTGCSTDMVPLRYFKKIPSSIEGAVGKNFYSVMLNSHLLKSWNVRYVSVGNWDKSGVEILNKAGYKLIKEVYPAKIFEGEGALPRIYFATHFYPYDNEQFVNVMVNNKGPVTSVFHPSQTEMLTLPVGKILRTDWRDNRIRIELDAPDGGFLVVSQTYFPQWNVVVDGRKAKNLEVNGLVQGVWVPPGAKLIEFRYQSAPFEIGLTLALCGGLGFLLWRHMSRRKEKE